MTSQGTFGLLNLYKPAGPSSHDVVALVRRLTRVKQVGHAGTLDPLAEGVLVLALGPATRLLEYLTIKRKRYTAQVCLGQQTSTDDAEGEIINERPVPAELDVYSIDQALAPFRGEIQQRPPAFSAVKSGGKRAYALARAGHEPDLPERTITILQLEVTRYMAPVVHLEIECSAGTYIRSLARDLGEVLGTGAHLHSLIRTASGTFTAEAAIHLPAFEAAWQQGTWQHLLLPAELALEGYPRVVLSQAEEERVRFGQALPADAVVAGPAGAFTSDGRLAAVLIGDPQAGQWLPKKVFL